MIFFIHLCFKRTNPRQVTGTLQIQLHFTELQNLKYCQASNKNIIWIQRILSPNKSKQDL